MPRNVDMKNCPHKGKGVMMLVLGLLVLLNAYYSVLTWANFVGVLLVLCGLIKLLKK